MLQGRNPFWLAALIVALGLSLSLGAGVARAGLVKPLTFHSAGISSSLEAPMEVEIAAQRGMRDVNLFLIGEDLSVHRAQMGSFTPGRTLSFDLDLPENFGKPTGIMLVGRMRRSVAVSMNESVARSIIEGRKTFSEVYGLRESDVLRSLRTNNLDGILNFINIAIRLTPAEIDQPNMLVKFTQGTEAGFVNFVSRSNSTPQPVPLPASGWMGLALLAVLGALAWSRHHRRMRATPVLMPISRSPMRRGR